MRRPGHDIYGQPTKVPEAFLATPDPRDGDPLDVQPDDPRLPRFREQPRTRRFQGCGWVIVLLVLAWLAAALIVRANLATPQHKSLMPAANPAAPRNVPVQPAQSGAPLDPDEAGAPSALGQPEGSPVWNPAVGVTGGAPPAAEYPPAPQLRATARASAEPVSQLADVTWTGDIGYADPSYGPRYLAIPAGPGVRVEVCGPAKCLIRTSTDAGPALFMQRAGRIADVSAVDFPVLCGVPTSYGLCPGTVLVLSRTRSTPPETSTEETP